DWCVREAPIVLPSVEVFTVSLDIMELDNNTMAAAIAVVVIVVLIFLGNKVMNMIIADDQNEDPKGSKWVGSEQVTTEEAPPPRRRRERVQQGQMTHRPGSVSARCLALIDSGAFPSSVVLSHAE
ncbi:unnamed protein product, partial [Prorocentrum cordatum]